MDRKRDWRENERDERERTREGERERERERERRGGGKRNETYQSALLTNDIMSHLIIFRCLRL